MTKAILNQDVQELQAEPCMNRSAIILLFIIVFGQSINAQTYYYKYTKSIIKGKPDTNVSGGQFITFDGSKCFESDKYGNNVGNGVMAYDTEVSKSTGLKAYWGSCYRSKNAYMKFNADKSVMNIETNAGKIYVYKRATAPAGVTTCSLIRKPEPSSDGSSGGGGYAPSYPVQTYPQGGYAGGGTYNGGNSGNTGGSTYRPERDKPQKTRHTCSACKGSGSIVRNDGSVSSYGNSGYMKRCPTCGEQYWSTTFHRHETCRICHGRGYHEF